MRMILAFLTMLLLVLVGCSSEPSTQSNGEASTTCTYAHAPGVTRVDSWPAPCSYICDPEQQVEWCDVTNRCTSLTVDGNCGGCGVTCGPTEVCRQGLGGGYFHCRPRL